MIKKAQIRPITRYIFSIMKITKKFLFGHINLLSLIYQYQNERNIIIDCKIKLQEMVSYKDMRKVLKTNLCSERGNTYWNRNQNDIDYEYKENITCCWSHVDVETFKVNIELEWKRRWKAWKKKRLKKVIKTNIFKL